MIKFKRRPSVEINSSSMADIAFLLLIFFLVTTTISMDQGLNIILPSDLLLLLIIDFITSLA